MNMIKTVNVAYWAEYYIKVELSTRNLLLKLFINKINRPTKLMT